MDALARFENSQPVEWYDKNYACKIRKFDNGDVEVSTYVVQSIREKARADRRLAGVPIRRNSNEPEEITPEQLLKRREDSVKKSVFRARQKLRWLVKQIGADHLLTLSYRDNMQDIERLKSDWKAFVRLVVARYPEWKYVCVHEKQDRGAFHLHVAVSGRQDIKYFRRCWYKVLGASPDASGTDTPGQVNVIGPSKRFGGMGYVWKANRLAGYIGKYLHKQFEESDKGAKRYWASKGISLPVPQKIWLGCSNFIEAVQVTHDIARACGVVHLSMWASEGWQSIWMCG